MLPFHQRQVVLFDLDGTVIDSQEGIFNALRYTFPQLGMELPDEEVLRLFIGPSIGNTFMKLFGLPQERADEAVGIYREYYSTRGVIECSPYPGIAELLDTLRAQGKRTALATKKPDMFAHTILERLDLSRRFDAVRGAMPNDSSEHKGYVLEHVLAELHVTDKAQAVMVGDTWYDCVGASQAGVDCIGVLYGFGDQAKMEEHGAAAFAADLPALHGLLCGS